jgi:hypothetical protein
MAVSLWHRSAQYACLSMVTLEQEDGRLHTAIYRLSVQENLSPALANC